MSAISGFNRTIILRTMKGWYTRITLSLDSNGCPINSITKWHPSTLYRPRVQQWRKWVLKSLITVWFYLISRLVGGYWIFARASIYLHDYWDDIVNILQWFYLKDCFRAESFQRPNRVSVWNWPQVTLVTSLIALQQHVKLIYTPTHGLCWLETVLYIW